MAADMNASAINNESDTFQWQRKKVSKLSVGLPVVKNLFLDVMSFTHTDYYGFSNGDILFSKDLMATIKVVDKFHNLHFPGTRFLIVGGRWNVNSTSIGTDVTNTSRLTYLRSIGKLQLPHTTDYFITPKNIPMERFCRCCGS